ncbi:hypothetical protein LTR49_028632 [Elasticomyces elasticus]|nr:hypothetical protein LTR49_028632 [Elasticomyces elasticus]
MAEDWQVHWAKQLIDWPYQDVEPIKLALTARDSECEDGEGHRMLTQYGDSLVPFIVATIGSQMGVTA